MESNLFMRCTLLPAEVPSGHYINLQVLSRCFLLTLWLPAYLHFASWINSIRWLTGPNSNFFSWWILTNKIGVRQTPISLQHCHCTVIFEPKIPGIFMWQCGGQKGRSVASMRASLCRWTRGLSGPSLPAQKVWAVLEKSLEESPHIPNFRALLPFPAPAFSCFLESELNEESFRWFHPNTGAPQNPTGLQDI